MPDAENFSPENLRVGLKVTCDREITEEDVLTFARLTGDHNPLHVDSDYARSSNYQARIVHGAFQVGLASALLGMHLPEKKVLLGSINSRFPAPLYFPRSIKISGEISAWNPSTRAGQLRVIIQDSGSSTVTAEVFMGFTLHEERRSETSENAPLQSSLTQGEFAQQREGLIVLTGASGGLGAHLLSALAQDYQVLALVHRRSLGNVAHNSPRVQELQADITDADLEAHLSSAIGDRRLYGLVHAAWPGPQRGSLLQADDSTISRELAFGTSIVVRLARTLFRHAPDEGGRLVAIGSTAGTVKPYLQMGVYSLAKASLEHTIKLLAPELARKKVTANVVCPSFVPVGINEQATERQIMMERAAIPMGRVCDPADVVTMVRYLLSPEASFISGQAVALTGAQL